MKCERCQDEGKLYMPGKFIKCPKCQEVSHEEYIRTCSRSELAKVIYEIAVTDKLLDRFFNAEIVNGNSGVKEAERWLQEIHYV